MTMTHRVRTEWTAAGPVQHCVHSSRKAVTGAGTFARAVTEWIRAGYPSDSPRGHVALLALCGTDVTTSA
jgi:hypothetical protein